MGGRFSDSGSIGGVLWLSFGWACCFGYLTYASLIVSFGLFCSSVVRLCLLPDLFSIF